MEVYKVSARGRIAYKNDKGEIFLTCTICNELKREDDFHNVKAGFLGKLSNCKVCQKAKNEANYKKNSDRIKAKVKEYATNNAEKVKEASKKWREENADKKRENDKKWREENPERVRKNRQNWVERNRDKHREQGRTWRKLNVEKARQHKSKWAKNNPEKLVLKEMKRRTIVKSLPFDFTYEKREELMNYYNHSCALTGSKDIHLDHVIPLCLEVVGSVFSNMLPLSAELNLDKKDKNVFEWVKTRPEIDQDRFNVVMTEVAERNSMTLDEYKAFVYDCFEKKVIK